MRGRLNIKPLTNDEISTLLGSISLCARAFLCPAINHWEPWEWIQITKMKVTKESNHNLLDCEWTADGIIFTRQGIPLECPTCGSKIGFKR